LYRRAENLKGMSTEHPHIVFEKETGCDEAPKPAPEPAPAGSDPSSLCKVCHKFAIEYEASECCHGLFCRKCAMKCATGGKCKVCGVFFADLRKIQ
jgi:hypothetical protein